jgi:hypothetical protein
MMIRLKRLKLGLKMGLKLDPCVNGNYVERKECGVKCLLIEFKET